MTAEPEATPAVENLLGRRIVAGLIDAVLLIVLLVIMSALFGESESSSGDDGASFSVGLNGLPAILYFLISAGYYLIMEKQSGQTLGKKVMGIRVVALEGSLSWGKVAIRTILRFVDGFPWVLPYLAGLIAIAVSKKKQRIGDMAAGTAVVRA